MWRMSCAKESEPRPLIMPLSQTLSNLNPMFSSPTSSPYCGYLLPHDFSAVNHHFSDEQQNKNKRGGNISINMEEVSMGSARWTPTPEQLYALEEIYQRGTRTPSANQIQQIALRLRRFGKIEGKNVFYWFQNHKARERQKRRRQQLNHHSLPNQQHIHLNNAQNLDINFSGLRTDFEAGQAKNWVTPSSDCSTVSEESVSLPPAPVFAKGEMDERIDEYEGRRLHQKTSISRSITVKPAMPRMMANGDINIRKNQTLELFPDWNFNGDDDHQMIDHSPKFNNSEVPIVNTNKFSIPTHFFEFL